MNTKALSREVGRRFVRYKFKSFLMMLGMLIGVFTLTTGMTLGAGFKISVTKYFNNIFLPDSITLAVRTDVQNAQPITEDDVAALRRELPDLGAWSPMIGGGRVDLAENGNNRRAALTGTGTGAPIATGQGAASGTYLSEEDVRSRAKVVLLGKTVRAELFGNADPIGKALTINSQVFQVKGVLDPLGADPHGGDLDNVLIIPYTTLMQMNRSDENLRNIRFRVNNSADVAAIAAQMGTLMRKRHNLTEGREDDFYIGTAPAGQAAFEQFQAMFRILLPVVVGIIFTISLFVIASIMMIGVKERTAEIGLRKAVGARAEEVEFQFLAEAVLLAIIAGVLGNAASYPGLLYVQQMYTRYGSDVSFLPSIPVLALSFGCALLTAVLAAWSPARTAAALSPVTALR